MSSGSGPELASILSGSGVHRNLSTPFLTEHAIVRAEGKLADNGALVALTGHRTGRSPKDKFTVRDAITEAKVDWTENQPLMPASFDSLYARVLAYLKGRELFVQDLFAGADPRYRLPIRIVNEFAWQNLFARQLFIRPSPEELKHHSPEFTVIAVPGLAADPKLDGVNSDVAVVINFSERLVLITGSHYAGEIKKSIFTIMNFLLPQRNVLPMHCSANVGKDGVTALFFGLSGTGKTTLSADPARAIIGDDEHGWSDTGIFNFEGGCYAKCIKLSREREPQIYDAIRSGCILENVALDPATRAPDYDSDALTENTRAAYPIEFIENAVIPGIGTHPSNILFLTADAFGVLPPISRLTPEQAMYHFLSGYTAKLAGTEAGVTEPRATFSTCFGAPFLPLDPSVYAHMLGERLRRHEAQCWLVNTGWIGGRYGVGKRMNLPYTRAMVTAAVTGKLAQQEFHAEAAFGLSIPKSCPGVPPELLEPRKLWQDKEAYDLAAADLASRFARNFEKFQVSPEIRQAGPTSILTP